MKKILIIAAVGLTLASCKKLEDLNIDEKNAVNGGAPSETLFANAQKNLMDQVATPNVNLNIMRLFSQYWTGTTYTEESNYNITTRRIPDFEFQAVYRDCLADLKEAKKLIEKEADAIAAPAVKKNKAAITEMLSVYLFQREVDIFGNVPYSQALDIENVLPAYDGAQSIYSALFTRLDAAINSIDVSAGGFPAKYDIIYAGNMTKWKTFGNSLKLRMAITVADVPALNPGTRAAEAVAAGVFTAASQSAMYQYLGASPNTNPVWVQLVSSGRKDWVISNTLIDKLQSLSDPRISKYCDGNLKDANGAVIYKGGIYGSNNKYANYTQVTKTVQQPTWKGNLLDYTEVQFYLAEAAERGFISGSAQAYYDEAVKSSILFWGGTTVEASAYLANPNVNYLTAPGTYKEKIGTQAWLAYFDRGEVAWTTYRRLDAPKMNIPTKSQEAVPNRMTYPVGEQTLNGSSYTAAAAAIGGDTKTTKLFWDKF
jgi:hypothetical protein